MSSTSTTSDGSHPRTPGRLDMDTEDKAYAQRLATLQGVWWKRLLPVQAPYQWNMRRQKLGRTLDVGCGQGRNLGVLGSGSIGVDHNPHLVATARSLGHEAYTVDEFQSREWDPFDSLLFAHVIEHMTADEGIALVTTYSKYLKPGGKVFFICPQERGFASDPTHVWFATGDALEDLARRCGLEPSPWRSFPFPRRAGRAFAYNEFNVLARAPR